MNDESKGGCTGHAGHMKKCRSLCDLLGDYVDGALEPEVAAELETHLQHCPPCERFLASYRMTSRVCREHLAKAMPEAMSERLRAFLRGCAGKGEKEG